MNRHRIADWGILYFVAAFVLFIFGGCGADKPKDGGLGGDAQVAVLALSAADATSVTVTVTAPDIASPIVASLAKSGTQWVGTGRRSVPSYKRRRIFRP